MPARIPRRALLGAAALPFAARAAPPRLRLGVLTALSGAYTDAAGEGSVVAATMAVEDFTRDERPPFAVEVLSADMQDRPDVGSGIARAWFDRDGVDAVVDVPNSAIALAVAEVARERNRVGLFSGPGVTALSGASCGPNHVQWTYDTHALAAGTAGALLAEGGDSWFFVAADYAYGRALRAEVEGMLAARGGRSLGGVAFPFPDTTDFSSYLLAAQASGAKVVGLACTGDNLTNAVKQAAEFRLGTAQRLAALTCLIHTVHAIGAADAQGLLLTEPFYWDLNDGTRAFARRFAPRYRGLMPSMVHAGAYSATLHWLRAAAALGPGGARNGAAVVAQMKRRPAEDPLFGRSTVRANGSVAHPMHLFRVVSPAEQRGEWDLYRLVRTIPADEAFADPTLSGCALARG